MYICSTAKQTESLDMVLQPEFVSEFETTMSKDVTVRFRIFEV